MTDLHVVRVFVGPDGRGGNPLGVVLDGAAVPPAHRQEVATRLGYSETVFVDDVGSGALTIYTPAAELPFAGHPLVGTGWLLRRLGHDTPVLRPPAGDVPAWQDGDLSWVTGRAAWAPPMTLRRYDTPAEVDALPGAAPGEDFLYAWAWLDEPAGAVRARSFPALLGIAEDEATGSAAVRLSAQQDRPLRIRQGAGSELLTRPHPDGTVSVGGLVSLDEVRML